MKGADIPMAAAGAGPVLEEPVLEESVSTSAVESVKPVKTRSNFPETWLWQLLEAG